ncbi:hypothetical protein SLS62_001711 [Diatrype stigma]|uniref:WW domain-containing protein n=1 Tax=Diatrype stigma TaxID=117547 RepID=A0AAN9V7R7_9PEZI
MTSESPVPPRPSEAEAEFASSNAPAKVIKSPCDSDEPPLEKEPATPPDRDQRERAATSSSNSESEGSARGESARGGSPAGSTSSQESGEVSPTDDSGEAQGSNSAPPLPDEAPPLPSEQPPPADDDGWDFQWDPTHQAYFFYNRFTNETTWENPRLSNPNAASAATSSSAAAIAPVPNAQAAAAEPPKNERPPAGGYNPAIHGDYDPNAWYAKGGDDPDDDDNNDGGLNGGSSLEQQGLAAPGLIAADPASAPAAIGAFNRFTGTWQAGDLNPERHNDEAKSRRQMNAFFDVDAAANSHDGRSLKAERSGKKPSKAELKAFKEKRRARKEEKRRAWLRD